MAMSKSTVVCPRSTSLPDPPPEGAIWNDVSVVSRTTRSWCPDVTRPSITPLVTEVSPVSTTPLVRTTAPPAVDVKVPEVATPDRRSWPDCAETWPPLTTGTESTHAVPGAVIVTRPVVATFTEGADPETESGRTIPPSPRASVPATDTTPATTRSSAPRSSVTFSG